MKRIAFSSEADAGSRQENASNKKRQSDCGTSARAGRFPCMAMKRALLISCVMMAAADVAGAQAPPGPTTPPAQTAPPSPERAANCAPMQPDAALRHGGSGRDHHRPAGRAARRQAGALGRRIVSAARRRSRNARACAGHRQDARDSATRQPRRRPDNPAEIALFCRCLAGPLALLDRSATHSLYAARSRMRYSVPRR